MFIALLKNYVIPFQQESPSSIKLNTIDLLKKLY